MKILFALIMCVLAAMSATAGDESGSNDAHGDSTSVHSRTELLVADQRLTLKLTGNSDGNMLLISNRTGFEIRVRDNLALDTLIEPDGSTSWGCNASDYVASYILETESGAFIESLNLKCGDVLYVVQE